MNACGICGLMAADPAEALSVASEVKRALEGDSNDAEHDALVEVAGFFGIEWTSIDDREMEGEA